MHTLYCMCTHIYCTVYMFSYRVHESDYWGIIYMYYVNKVTYPFSLIWTPEQEYFAVQLMESGIILL